MKLIFDAINQRAEHSPKQPAIVCDGTIHSVISNAELVRQIAMAKAVLREANVSCLGIYLDNCAQWIFYDLAAAQLGICVVPIPLFFTPKQIQHLLDSASIDAVLVINALTQSQQYGLLGEHHTIKAAGNTSLLVLEKDSRANSVEHKVAKITFTSGSTGQPKGVCLSHKNIETVCQSLQSAMLATQLKNDINHLCVMPLATLLENIAGVYVPLMRGGTVITKPIQALGFQSNNHFDAEKLIPQLKIHSVGSMILFPQILENLVKNASCDFKKACQSLEFIAVGGGTISEEILYQAQQFKLPVYQGYGLSECGSVVCLNLPKYNKLGSVGKALGHVDVTVNNDGEIIVNSQAMLGYLGEELSEQQQIATGDLGHIDAQGYVYVTGRKNNTLISSFGRNISPEWVEAALTSQPEVKQAAVMGDAQAALSAVIVLENQRMTAANIVNVIKRVNDTLPDYAHIQSWLISEAPFTPENNLLTDNGRLKRSAIAKQYQAALSQVKPSVKIQDNATALTTSSMAS